MLDNERRIIDQFAVDLISHVFPNEVLPYLLCLSEDDRDQIQAKQTFQGPRAAVWILLERLKKRQGSFKQFLTALEQTGCGHIKTKLENALRDQEHHLEPEHSSNVTPETTSNLQPETLKTPTTETARPFAEASLPETKQSIILSTPKKPNKRLKLKKRKTPKENTTSPTESKTGTNVKTKSNNKATRGANGTTSTPPKASGVSDGTTKSRHTTQKDPKYSNSSGMSRVDPAKDIPSTNPRCTQSSAITNQIPNSRPSKTDSNENSKTLYDTLVCYAKKNREIALELKQFLETECNLQVCIDLVNFIPGKAYTDNICESINSSGSVIFLLSPEFLTKDFAPWELKNAVYDSNVSQKYKKIIPVLLEECQVPKELEIYTAIKMEGSGSRKDCWRKLAAAILDRPYGHGDVDDGVDDDDDGVDDGLDDDDAYDGDEDDGGDDVDDDGDGGDDVDDNDGGDDGGGGVDDNEDGIDDDDDGENVDVSDDEGGDDNGDDDQVVSANHDDDDVSDDVDYNGDDDDNDNGDDKINDKSDKKTDNAYDDVKSL